MSKYNDDDDDDDDKIYCYCLEFLLNQFPYGNSSHDCWSV